jgi:murein DD-endopeptidase MepM/ murein hydrolase activator NlpD
MTLKTFLKYSLLTALSLTVLTVSPATFGAHIPDPAKALTNKQWGVSIEDPNRLEDLASWDLPVPSDLPITSCYGPRRLLHRYKEFHKGIDFGAPSQTSVYAVAYGKVIWRGSEPCSGKTLIVEHILSSGKSVLSIYRHLHNYNVKVGQLVDQGDLIALSGASGKKLVSTQPSGERGCISGPHLHIEFKLANDGVASKTLEWIVRKSHGHLSEYVHEANPSQFIPRLRSRCTRKISA